MSEQIPRVEVGRFAKRSPSKKRARASGGHVGRIVGNEIVVEAGRKTVGRRRIEAPPKESWGDPCAQALLHTGDCEHLWHLGYESGAAKLDLIDASTLETVATHHPVMRQFSDDYTRNTVGPIASWYELDASTSEVAPSALLARANCGDSFAYLFVVERGADGIAGGADTKLYDAVARRLDARLMSAELVVEDRLLTIDDIGNLGLYHWRTGEELARFSIMNGLRNEEGKLEVWPDDPDDDPWLEALCTAGIVEGTLFVNLTDGDTNALRALVALDIGTLSPLGLVRPPDVGVGELYAAGGASFAGGLGRARFEWIFERC